MKAVRIIIAAAALLLFTGCADMFQSKIAMDTQSQPGTISRMLAVETVETTLGIPAQVLVSKGTASNSIALSWQTVKNASYYRLERAVVTAQNPDGTWPVPKEEDFSLVKEFVYKTQYTDTIATLLTFASPEYGYRYYYRICAENPLDGFESGGYSTPVSGYLFAPVQSVEAGKGLDLENIRVTWTPVTGAFSYKIYRDTGSTGSNETLAGTVSGGRSYFDDPVAVKDQGTEFYYRVYAQNSSGNLSVASNIAMGFSAVEGAPPSPDGVTVADGRGTTTDSITVKWAAADGADVTYTVYRSSSVDAAYTLLKKGLTEASYTDRLNLRPGVYYYYFIQAVAMDTADDGTVIELKSSFSVSGADSESPAEGFILSPPDTVSVVDGSDSTRVRLRWSPAIGAPEEQAAYHYAVYCDDTLNGDFTQLLVTLNAAELAADSDGLLCYEAEKKNFYRIKTVNTDGLESAFSMKVAPVPPAPAGVVATQAENLSAGLGSMTANERGVYPVKITWEKSAGNVAGYHVYRSTSADSGFRKITDKPLADCSCIDENDVAKPGVRYYYKVLPLNELEQGLNYSDGAIGYGALTAEQFFLEYNKTVKNSQKKLTLMHKSNDMDKLGSENAGGTISGTLAYNAKIDGLGARITMHYENYADYYISNDKTAGVYFNVTGDTNTSASMDASGTMDGTVVCTGMYNGTVGYGKVEIKAGAAGGGCYIVTVDGFTEVNVGWEWGEK